MHLLVAAHDLYPDPGSGGTGRFVYETGRRLVDRGHRVTVVTRRRGDAPHRDAVEGMDVWRYDLEIAGRTAPAILSQLPDAAGTVRRAVTAAEPDLLSLQGPATGQLVDLATPGDVPRSCTFHSPWPTEYRIRTRDGSLPSWRRTANVRLRRALEGRLLDRAGTVQTLSRYMRTQLRTTYGATHDPAIVPGGVDADVFHPDAHRESGAESPIDRDGRRETAVVTVRRLSPRMGHDLLLEAFDDLAALRPEVHLYLAGDGPLRDDLAATAAERGIADRVTFLGYVPDEALPGLYADADLFVVPTTELEGFGLATLEALAAGTPVVATPVGGTVEVLSPLERRDAVPARLVADDVTPDALRERLDRWTGLDRERRECVGTACRRYAVEEYPWDGTVDALERRYHGLLGTDERAAVPRRWQVER